MELVYSDLLAAGRLLRSRQVSAVELAGAMLDRIARLDPLLHADARVAPEQIQPKSDRLLARSAGDAAALLAAVAGADPCDPSAARLPVPGYLGNLRTELAGLRIGLDADTAFGGVDVATVAAVTGAIEVLRTIGAELREIRFPDVSAVVADWFPVCAVQTAVAHAATYPARKAEYGEALAALIELGRSLSGMDYQKLILRRMAFKGRVDTLFDEVDLIVLPVIMFADTTLERMRVVDDALITGVHRYTCPFTMSGHPALTLPCGFTHAGTPLAFQFVGRHFEEASVLAAAHAYQQVTDWHQRRPAL